MNREGAPAEGLTVGEGGLDEHRAQLRSKAEGLAAGFARVGVQRAQRFGSTTCGRTGLAREPDLLVARADP